MAATPEQPRLAPLPPKEWPKAAVEALAPLLPPTGRPKGENRPKGLNALGMLARYPELALAYNTFSGQIMYRSKLSPRYRELLVLRVAAVRRSLGGVRTGHAGTLDPFATGLLLILVGRATKAQRALMELPKRYRTVARLGASSSKS